MTIKIHRDLALKQRERERERAKMKLYMTWGITALKLDEGSAPNISVALRFFSLLCFSVVIGYNYTG